MKFIFSVIDYLLETLLFITLASMCAVVAINVFCRFVLDFSLSWPDETAMILMVWFTFLGAALGTRDKTHYAFDFLVRSLPVWAKRPVRIIGEVICILMAVGLFYWSGKVTVEIRHWIMPATEISRALVYMACPIGSFFLLLYALRNFGRDLLQTQPVAEHKPPTTVEAAEEETMI